MTVRQLLDNRRTAKEELQAIEAQISAHIGGVGCSATRYRLVPACTNNAQAAHLQHEDYYYAALESLRAEKQRLFLAAEKVIEAHPDWQARCVLRYYYCSAYTDEKIGNILYKDTSAVCRRRNAAVDWLEEKYKNVEILHEMS